MSFPNIPTVLPPTLIVLIAISVLAIIGYDDYSNQELEISPSNSALYPHVKTEKSPQSTPYDWTQLFGKIADNPADKTVESLPETRLDLTLAGTFTHADTNKASALIAESGKQSERYFVGEQVHGDAELVKVNTGSVVLRRNGQDELLSLPILQANSKSSSTNRKPNRPSNYSDNNESSANISTSRIEAEIGNRAKTNTNSATQNNSLKDRLAQLRAKRNKSE